MYVLNPHHPVAARVAAGVLLVLNALIGLRVVFALLRGDWVVALIGLAILLGSLGMVAFASNLMRSQRR